MIILIVFAFLSGIVTILSPCILPVLPIVLSSSLIGGKKRPLGIVTGFIISFTFFTLFLSAIVRATHISADSLRTGAVVLLVIFGVSLFIPKFQIWMELFISRITSFISNKISSSKPSLNTNRDEGYVSGIPIGASLGLIWAPCVGPIIASVIALAATSQVNSQAVFITLAYSLGTAIPLLGITYGGRTLLAKNPWLLTRAQSIQKVFGVLMFVTAVGIFFNVDRKFQAYILTVFPNYGTGLTALEENPLVKSALQQLNPNASNKRVGRPMNEIQDTQGVNLPKIGIAPGFQGQSGEWINSEPITLESLRGKVVLVDFWTYTCINCIRTFPYLTSWYEKYKDKGLVIVGVHTPEFEFEKNVANVKAAAKDFSLPYPIVQDNDFGIWQAYNNHYWPAHYLIDKDGYIRNEHIGEGSYDETEQHIQTLLNETGSNVTDVIDNPSYTINTQTREMYLGYDRVEYNVSPEGIKQNQEAIYSAPSSLPPNTFAYEGAWTIGNERAKPGNKAKLLLNFNAKHVFLVMRPLNNSTTTTAGVSLNGSSVSNELSGEDVQNGVVTISSDRLYKLIKLPAQQKGTLTIEFNDANVEVFAFTFG